jgi:hypothetical protein
MRVTSRAILACLSFIVPVIFLSGLSAGAAALSWTAAPTFTQKSTPSWQVKFELSEYSDVEVAIVNQETGSVVRHLAAGMLGDSAPFPLVAGTLPQTIDWDGLNDYGSPPPDYANVAVRVRAGISVAMDKIVGGDPYGWFSYENDTGDHAAWSMKQAIDVKSDGKVFIYGNTSALGAPMIRQYDAEGNYQKTVFPFAADKPLQDVAGWGIRVKADGSYAPAFSSLTHEPTITDSYVVAKYSAHTGTFIPSPQNNDALLVMTTEASEDKLLVQKFNVDGTIGPDSRLGPLITSPSLPSDSSLIGGNFYTAFSNDAQYLYISSLYDVDNYANPDNFYHEGQVFKVDMATGGATQFYDQGVVVDDSAGVYREGGFTQIHGLAVDNSGNVFLCDRLHGQIVVLSPQGQVLRQLPIPEPDNVAVADTGALYVVTKTTHETDGEIYLHKFTDWRTDTAPSSSVFVANIVGVMPDMTDIAIAPNGGDPRIWVTYVSAPVKIYSDGPEGLKLSQDFALRNTQNNLTINAVTVDSTTGTLYVTDAFNNLFSVKDWDNPRFERAMLDESTALPATSIAIDERNRYLYSRIGLWPGPIARWHLDSDGYFAPAPTESGSNIITEDISYGWYIRTGTTDRGFDVAPDGSLAISGDIGGEEYPSFLKYYQRDEAAATWNSLLLDDRRFEGARVDLRGNIYASHYDGPPTILPSGFESDPFYVTDEWDHVLSRIYKFTPTGSAESGSLYPVAPDGPAKIYDVPYGMTAPEQPATFGVDGYGRILYPTAIAQRITLIDNEGNELVSFGTYGNADSRGGLSGELVPTADIPLAYAHTVDISDDYIYIGDLNNNRVIRVAMKYALESVRPLTMLPPGC